MQSTADKGPKAMMPSPPSEPIELNGQLERITYADAQSGFTIALVQIIGRRHMVTVVGDLMAPAPGTILQMQGHWIEHPTFGPQFRVSQYRTQVPVSKKGIERYLGSGLIKGIGPETARHIVKKFGGRTLQIIEQQPGRLTEVPGIGAKKAAAIQHAWQDHQETRQVMLFLQEHGVGVAQAMKIFHHYGQATIVKIQKNPYRLAKDIFGIGFLTADQIATRLGFDSHSPLRLKAGVLHVLNQLADDGHLYFPHDMLVRKAAEMLRTEPAAVATAIGDLAAAGQLVVEPVEATADVSATDLKAVYLARFHLCETFTARHLNLLLQAPRFHPQVDTERALAWVQRKLSLQLPRDQQAAVTAALTRKVLVITGGPGTGKTTIIRAITRLYEQMSAQVLLAAPTGRAAKRLSEATARTARTIHRLLEYKPHEGGFQKDHLNPLEGDLLVVDEASMIDAVLMYHLLKAVPVTTTLILVGDVNQLPSVGPGNVLKDILGSGAVPQVTLTEIFRQAQSSRIVVNAHAINAGHLPDLSPPRGEALSDFYFIEQEDPEKILATILALTSERIPRRFGFDALDDIQVLSPMYRGVAGAKNLNLRLQQTLNPQQAYVARGEQRFGAGDKVMQIRNNYEKDIFNGDIGRIALINPEDKKVIVRFDERRVDYDFAALEELVLAYAVSVHKSQGSEYPAVVIPVTTTHYPLLQRNLIYTAVTRAKQLVVLVGTRRALALAVRNNAPQKRHTRLATRLNTTHLRNRSASQNEEVDFPKR
jgi:exodeoxyribonuclease V alpha subunit